MRKQFIKNIKGLIQAGEDLPTVLRGAQMRQLAIIENAYLALEDNEVIAYGPMNEWPGITDWRECYGEKYKCWYLVWHRW